MSRTNNRIKLVLVVALFALPMLAAIALNAMGWRPPGTRNFGLLIEPPQDISALTVVLDSDGDFTWHSANHGWTLVARVPEDCAADCIESLAELPRVRFALGRHAPRLRMLLLDQALPNAHEALMPFQFGAGRDPRLAELMPAPPRDLGVWLVDDRGFLVLHYPPGFDRSGLRKDLARLLK